MTSTELAEIVQRLDTVEAQLPVIGRDLVNMQNGDLGIIRKSTDFDLLTVADTACERRLVELIRGAFPEDQILAEEGGGTAEATSRGDGYLWILDPIDGTTNYANRLPNWGISVGLMRAGCMVGGLVAAPSLGLLYRAVAGQGATCNSESIHVGEFERLGAGVIATGFPYDRAQRAAPICRALENVLREAGGVRRLGAASLDFCFVADGRFAGYYEMGLKPWDYAAGSLIAAEAGAVLTDFVGGPLDIFQSKGHVTTNGRIHDALVQAVGPMMVEAASL